MKKNVLLLETIADEAFQELKNSANVFLGLDHLQLTDILKSHEIHAVITRGKGQVDKELIEACPDLEVIARCGVGLDNVDVSEATRKNIKVINAPGSNAATIAEHTLALMLMLIRNMYTSATKVREGDWAWRNHYSGDELQGKTLGILGLGNIGKKVARLGEAFGMRVVYWDRHSEHGTKNTEVEPSGENSSETMRCEGLPLNEVLRQADVISLHLPLADNTRHLIGEREFEIMKPEAILINTARGSIIQQEALNKALIEKKIGGFGADVLETEPPLEHDPIVKHPNTIITAHIGSLTSTTYRNMCLSTVRNVLAALSGERPEPQSIFNRKALGIIN